MGQAPINQLKLPLTGVASLAWPLVLKVCDVLHLIGEAKEF